MRQPRACKALRLDPIGDRPYQHAQCCLSTTKAVRILNRMLATLYSYTALRRATAVVCALAFLMVAFAHTLHRCDAMAASAPSHHAMSMPGDVPDADKQAPSALDHCCACTMVMVPGSVQAIAAVPVTAVLPVVAPDHIRAHVPAAELRPPILTA